VGVLGESTEPGAAPIGPLPVQMSDDAREFVLDVLGFTTSLIVAKQRTLDESDRLWAVVQRTESRSVEEFRDAIREYHACRGRADGLGDCSRKLGLLTSAFLDRLRDRAVPDSSR
jgi:hypothetical protein